MTLKRKGLLFLPLFFLLCVPPVFSQDGLYLSSPEVKSIRAELENMRLEVLSLRMSQEASLKDSKLLQEKCIGKPADQDRPADQQDKCDGYLISQRLSLHEVSSFQHL